MSLTNEQFDTLLRGYAERRRAARIDRDRRHEEVLQRIPAFQALEEATKDAVSAFSARLAEGVSSDVDGTQAQFADIRTRKAALLTEAGFPADYLDLTYTCADCKDTGLIGGEKCHCFRRREIDLLYAQSQLPALAGGLSFSALRDDPGGSESTEDDQRRFRGARDAAQAFAGQFPESGRDLLFMGDVGTGKTTLSVCIARELLERGFSVIYFSAVSLFERLSRARFSRDHAEEDAGLIADLTDCDLLVIDDLGTELTNAFVEEQLFVLLNERDIRGKRMVISTNLELGDLQRIYADRIFSRITSGFAIYKLTGPDLRRVMRQA